MKATLLRKYRPKAVYPQIYYKNLVALLKKKTTVVHVLENADYDDKVTSSITIKIFFK